MHALRTTFSATLGRAGLIALLTALTVASGWTVASAADRVTLVLRSGEKITGDLDGMVNNQIYVRTSFSDQPKVPIEQIAMIDVGGDAINPPASELNEARGDAHLLVPQSGSAVKGRFVTLEGSPGNVDSPKTPEVVFRTESGEERRLPINQVRRLYFGNYRPKDDPAPTASSQPVGAGERVISVMANQQWIDTGVTVRQGDRVTFNASGEVTLSADSNDKAKPGGSVTQRRAANAPVPDAQAGALIGRVGAARGGSGSTFAIGDQTTVTMPGTGRLFLGVNDDHAGDNSGQFEVRIKVDRAGSSDDSANARRYRRR